jgi:DnaJ-domain-containing proteins 1
LSGFGALLMDVAGAFDLMDLAQSYFALFGLPETFSLDAAQLERARLAVQSQVHPDRFASGSDRDKRLAMQMAAQANAAYLTSRTRFSARPTCASGAAWRCRRRTTPPCRPNF